MRAGSNPALSKYRFWLKNFYASSKEINGLYDEGIKKIFTEKKLDKKKREERVIKKDMIDIIGYIFNINIFFIYYTVKIQFNFIILFY